MRDPKLADQKMTRKEQKIFDFVKKNYYRAFTIPQLKEELNLSSLDCGELEDLVTFNQNLQIDYDPPIALVFVFS